MKQTVCVKKFLADGTFFAGLPPETILPLLKKDSHDTFGSNIKMYYFYRHGYTISFVYDENHHRLKSEQIEISHPKKIKNHCLKSIIKLPHIPSDLLDQQIEKIYADQDEWVIFLNNGINLYYNQNQHGNAILSKIISFDSASRLLAQQLMQPVQAQPSTT